MFNKLFKSKEETTPTPDSKGATVARLPKMYEDMVDAKILKWYFKEGDTIKNGDIIADVETDKAVMELESYDTGTVLYISVEEGEKVAVDDILTIVGERGEDISHLLNEKSQKSPSNIVKGIVGEVKMYAGEEIPDNWLLCDGSSIPQSDKIELFKVIGHKFGGDDAYFNLPKLEDKNGIVSIICAN